MFRSLMTIIKELYPYLTKVIIMLKQSALHTTHMPLYDMLPHHLIYITTNFTECFNINITLVRYR